MRRWLILLVILSAMQTPLPIPLPDDGGCKLVIINGKACVVCRNIIQC